MYDVCFILKVFWGLFLCPGFVKRYEDSNKLPLGYNCLR